MRIIVGKNKKQVNPSPADSDLCFSLLHNSLNCTAALADDATNEII